MTEQEQVQVSQADRDAAAAYWHGWSNNVPEHDGEFHPLVLLLARHRHTATAEALEAMREALDAPMIDHSGRKRGVYDILRAAIAKIEGQQP
jgi:hypothetical protein